MEEVLQHIDAILASLVTLITTIVAIFGAKRVNKTSEKNKVLGVRNGHTAAIEGNHQVYGILQHLLHELPANRILLLKSENGGGIPRPGSPLFISAMFEVHDSSKPSVRADFQRYPVDEGYLGMLRKLLRDGSVDLKLSETNSGLLRGVYERQGIEQSWIYSVGFSNKAFYFLSFNNSKIVDLDDSYKTELEIASVKFRKILNLKDVRQSLNNQYNDHTLLDDDDNAL